MRNTTSKLNDTAEVGDATHLSPFHSLCSTLCTVLAFGADVVRALLVVVPQTLLDERRERMMDVERLQAEMDAENELRQVCFTIRPPFLTCHCWIRSRLEFALHAGERAKANGAGPEDYPPIGPAGLMRGSIFSSICTCSLCVPSLSVVKICWPSFWLYFSICFLRLFFNPLFLSSFELVRGILSSLLSSLFATTSTTSSPQQVIPTVHSSMLVNF